MQKPQVIPDITNNMISIEMDPPCKFVYERIFKNTDFENRNFNNTELYIVICEIVPSKLQHVILNNAATRWQTSTHYPKIDSFEENEIQQKQKKSISNMQIHQPTKGKVCFDKDYQVYPIMIVYEQSNRMHMLLFNRITQSPLMWVSGRAYTEGGYSITYTAEDTSGLKNSGCTVAFQVKGMTHLCLPTCFFFNRSFKLY